MVKEAIKEFTDSLEDLSSRAIEYRRITDELMGEVLVDVDTLRLKLVKKARKAYVDPE